MKAFTPTSAAFCKEYTEKLLKHPLAKAFAQPIDRNADFAPEYFRIISKPIDISTIKKNLENGAYASAQDWKSDMDLVWKNAMTFNRKGTVIFVAAEVLEHKCERDLAKVPQQEMDLVAMKIAKINRQIDHLMAFPVPEHSIVPRDH